MIREITVEEVPMLSEAASMFAAEGNPGGFEKAAFCANWQRLIRSGVGRIAGMFGPDGQFQGAMGAIFAPDMFNGKMQAIEAFWYVMPKFRGRGLALFNEFEEWAKAKGASKCAMIHLTSLQPATLRKLYESRGYREIETHYVKDLQP